MRYRKEYLQKEKESVLGQFYDSIIGWVGSWPFFIVHILWFSLWLIARLDLETLIMIVSLEAILLMILLLMQQKRQIKRDDLRDEADYQTDRRTMEIAEQSKRIVREIEKRTEKLEMLLRRSNTPRK